MHDDDYDEYEDQDDGLDDRGLTDAQRRRKWDRCKKDIERAKRLVFVTTEEGKKLKLVHNDSDNVDWQI